MNKKRLSTLEHTNQVKITLTSDQIKYIDKECKKRFNMINRSHMIRQLIIDSIEKEKVEEILKKLYYISILDYKQLNIFENNES